MTTEQIRIRLSTDELKDLKKLAERYDLNAAALSAVFVKAALRAVLENGGRVVLPLTFKLHDPKAVANAR